MTIPTKIPLIILMLLISFGSVGAVLFTPALPQIATFFRVSAAHAQFTITSFLIGYALGQLPYGPLANRFGRKKTLYIGIAISIIGSLLCALAGHFESFGLLVFARFIQALGACVGVKISFTMIADLYDQTEGTKMISRTMIAFAIMPGVGVAIGGWLTRFLGWESCFYFLALFGGLVLWLSSKLPETAKHLDQGGLKVRTILEGYAAKFKNRRLVISGLIMGCGTAVIYIFASRAPFVGINVIGMTPDTFGTYNLIPPVGMLLGSLLAAKLAGRFSFQGLLLTGTIGSLLCTLTMLVPFALGVPTAWSLFVPMALIYIAEALVFSNVSSYGLTNAKNKSNGSAVLNFINIGASVVAVFLSEMIYPESAIVMPIGFILLFLAMLWFFDRLKKEVA